MNVEKLREVQQRIEEMDEKAPIAFHMEHWVTTISRTETLCKTAACIAGHLLLIEEEKKRGTLVSPDQAVAVIHGFGRWDGVSPGAVAAKILELTPEQADRLFLGASWPRQFVLNEKGELIYNNPKIAVQRIEHFIATEGRE